MLGVMFSAITLYYFSDLLGFSEYFKKNKSAEEIKNWEVRLRSPKSTLIILGWSFFPFVPTDLICYISGIIKLPIKNMLIGVFFGELILDIFYVYWGAEFFTSL